MSRIARILICTVLLLGILSSTAFAEGKDALPGYLLAILLGFGTGHFYIEVDGVPLLLVELVGLGMGVVGGVLIIAGAASAVTSVAAGDAGGVAGGASTAVFGYLLAGVGGGVYVIARIVEIVGIFVETDKQREAGVVASTSVEPTFELRPDAVSAGLRLRY